jgi:hypothetical protein
MCSHGSQLAVSKHMQTYFTLHLHPSRLWKRYWHLVTRHAVYTVSLMMFLMNGLFPTYICQMFCALSDKGVGDVGYSDSDAMASLFSTCLCDLEASRGNANHMLNVFFPLSHRWSPMYIGCLGFFAKSAVHASSVLRKCMKELRE